MAPRLANYQIRYGKAAPRLRHEFFTFGARETCFVRDEIWMRWLLEHGVAALVSLPAKDNYEYYIETASSMRLFRVLVRKMAAGWGRHLREYPRKKQALIKAAEELGRVAGESLSAVGDPPPFSSPLAKGGGSGRRGIPRTTGRSLLQCYSRYLKAAYEFCDYIWGAWAVIYIVEPILMRRAIQEIGSPRTEIQSPNILEAITALDQPIEYMKMRRDLFRLSPPQWVKRYAWVRMYNPYDAPFTARVYANMQRELTQREVRSEFAQFAKARRQYRALLRSVRDPKLRRYCEMAHAYAFLKTDRIDAWRQTMLALRPFYGYVASLVSRHFYTSKHRSASERVKFSLRDACNLTVGEIVKLLPLAKGELEGTGARSTSPNPSLVRRGSVDLPTPREIRLRSENRALYYLHDRTIEIVTGGQAIAAVRAQIEGVQKSETTLSGIVACKGHARGRAVIVTHTGHLKKVRKGDIFIAKFTFPSFTPYMLKAAGFVTDDGGITAHAAVLSREYGIPCVIGTKTATKVLKDGDWVEVDAERGIVRKI